VHAREKKTFSTISSIQTKEISTDAKFNREQNIQMTSDQMPTLWSGVCPGRDIHAR
jgi:hypothetical protein